MTVPVTGARVRAGPGANPGTGPETGPGAGAGTEIDAAAAARSLASRWRRAR
jgi:hypothetical protein